MRMPLTDIIFTALTVPEIFKDFLYSVITTNKYLPGRDGINGWRMHSLYDRRTAILSVEASQDTACFEGLSATTERYQRRNTIVLNRDRESGVGRAEYDCHVEVTTSKWVTLIPVSVRSSTTAEGEEGGSAIHFSIVFTTKPAREST